MLASQVRRLLPVFLLLILLPVVALALAQATDGTWQTLTDAPEAPFRHDDAAFVTPSLGWVINTEGEIHKTTDGGATWTRQLDDEADLGYRVFFRSIGMATAQVGWAGNLGFTNRPVAEHALFETRDGGTTWTDITGRIEGPRPGGICGLWVVSAQVAYGVGRWNGPPIFLKTTDGGLRWTATDLRPLATGLVDVIFFDENTGLVIGGDGVGSSSEAQQASRTVILRTTDGGETWQRQYHGETPGKWGWKFSFPTPDIGYAATQGPTPDGVVLKTTNGGLTWTRQTVGVNTGFSGIGFATARHGWVAGATPFETTDGGETWRAASSVGENINRFRMLSDTLGYAVGRRVYKFTASRQVHRAAPPEAPAARLASGYPNPFREATTIGYTLPRHTRVVLTVHDVLGRRVATLVDRPQAPGSYRAGWDGTDAGGARQPAGVYLYRLAAGATVQTRRLVLLR